LIFKPKEKNHDQEHPQDRVERHCALAMGVAVLCLADLKLKEIIH